MAKAAEWAKRVAEWRASGLGAAEFCAGREYSAKTLWYWSSKLGRAARETQPGQPAVRLVRVAREDRAASLADTSGIVVEVGDARLMLHGQVDPAGLRAVLAVVREMESSR